ncbi:MAG: N-acetylmuramoyl-L-alanine amidase [Clostridiales bacterium]|nr:N-acetylmuramoyl-L-alanine amidase [Clostridiales bacterium]
MDVILVKKAAYLSFILMVFIVMISLALTWKTPSTEVNSNRELIEYDQKGEDIYSSNNINEDNRLENTSNDVEEGDIVLSDRFPNEIITFMDKKVVDKLGNRFLMIKKPQGRNLDIQIEDIYISKSLRLSFINDIEIIFNYDMFGRVLDKEFFIGIPQYSESVIQEIDESGNFFERVIKNYGYDFVQDIVIENKFDDILQLYVSEVTLQMDNVYEPFLYEDNAYYYIDLKKPEDVFDRIIVVDAGHGGKHSGAISKKQEIYEKYLNLKIVTYLKEYLDKENIKVYYTRLYDETVYLNPRVELANAVNCDFFISIHCNSSLSTSPKGTEILYYDTYFKDISAKELANIFMEELLNQIPLNNRGLIKMQEDDIYILKKATVPSILIEVGYISNDSDLQFLIKDGNQKKVALGIYKGILKAYERFY